MAEARVIGIDLGGTNIKGAAVNAEGKIVVKEERSTEADKGMDYVTDKMAQLARDLAQNAGWKWDDVTGVGITVPGFCDFDRGIVEEAVNIGWKNVPIVEVMTEKLGRPIYFENDANAAALGEAWAGAGRGRKHVLAITVGTGIGGGIIIDGKVYRGSNGMAGEVGHLIVDENADRCGCGHIGCIEAISSAPATVRRAQRAVDAGQVTRLRDVSPITTRDIYRLAEEGDAVAQEVVSYTMDRLGYALSLMANVLNPQVIVVGGGVSAAGETLLTPLRASFGKFALQRVVDGCVIVPAELGNDAGVIGAAGLALHQ